MHEPLARIRAVAAELHDERAESDRIGRLTDRTV